MSITMKRLAVVVALATMLGVGGAALATSPVMAKTGVYVDVGIGLPGYDYPGAYPWPRDHYRPGVRHVGDYPPRWRHRPRQVRVFRQVCERRVRVVRKWSYRKQRWVKRVWYGPQRCWRVRIR